MSDYPKKWGWLVIFVIMSSIMGLIPLTTFAGNIHDQLLGKWETPDGILVFHQGQLLSMEDESGMTMIDHGKWMVYTKQNQNQETTYLRVEFVEDNETIVFISSIEMPNPNQAICVIESHTVNGEKDPDLDHLSIKERTIHMNRVR